MSRKSDAQPRRARKGFTDKQGQYLAFNNTYSRMFRRSPAETDLQRHFRASPPTVHSMILTLQRNGLIRRGRGTPRSIELLVAPQLLPILEWLEAAAQNHSDAGYGWTRTTDSPG